jgi:beta-glucuronidase
MKTKLSTGLAIFFCLVPALVSALVPAAQAQQPSALITNIDGRNAVSLDGRWQTIIDPYETGFYDYRYQERGDGYFKNAKPKTPNELIEYDFDSSPQLKVPGDWNSQDDKYLFYEGTMWYKRSFDHQKKPGTRLFVYFGGANYTADVYLNGQKLGRHVGGFTPFNFEVTSLVREKDNFLVVRVDDKRSRDAVPTLNTDWWNYGGLTRSVDLVEVPDTFIQDYFLQLKKGSMDEFTGWVKLNGPNNNAANKQVSIEIPEAKIKQSVTTDANGYAPVSFKGRVDLWSPENPKLYQVNFSAGNSVVTDRIGFRSIETRGTDILLNGKPVFLRGISIHEESPLRRGRAFSEGDARLLLGWAKELGCNFVRLAHYPHNENMLRVADEMGIMVWSEIPVYWTILWENQDTFENAKNQLTENITRDKNKASVVLWSVANETPVGESRTKFLKGLIDHARSLDPTRLLTAANERHYTDPTTQLVDDPLGEYLDVLGCNEYVGWYDGPPEKAEGLSWKVPSNKPLIMSEFGGDAAFGKHGDKNARWTEEYQRNIYEHQIAMLKKIPSLRGMSPWILTDFRSPRRPLPGIQDFYNRKGLISSEGERKQAFFTLQTFYRELIQTNR